MILQIKSGIKDQGEGPEAKASSQGKGRGAVLGIPKTTLRFADALGGLSIVMIIEQVLR